MPWNITGYYNCIRNYLLIMGTNDRIQHFGSTSRQQLISHLRQGWLRPVLFALIWWILTGGTTESWWIGAPLVLFVTGISMAFLPPVSWSLTGMLRFIPFFIWRSLYGGIDVARRALHPRLPISPGLYDHHWRLPPGLPRVFMANTVSLLPGTLSTELNDKCLRVHVLDKTGIFSEELRTLENQVAGVFGLDLARDRSEV